jgi:tRNA threonylcarbamoyl adenosine modification protein (Sua5/YciO/YrdC/YwlC family)
MEEELNFEKKHETVAVLLDPNEQNMLLCGERIRQGKLVSFPTETVYGLGADATNEEAVLSIFEAKGRPLTDPVIVHIADEAKVDRILLDTPERALIKYLGSKLWPGPLTMIGPCDTSYIPSLVGSNTGTVGVRWPNNPIAQELILKADRPIAAPSANRFMHVSPTKYSHVFYDLYDKDVAIIKGG